MWPAKPQACGRQLAIAQPRPGRVICSTEIPLYNVFRAPGMESGPRERSLLGCGSCVLINYQLVVVVISHYEKNSDLYLSLMIAFAQRNTSLIALYVRTGFVHDQ